MPSRDDEDADRPPPARSFFGGSLRREREFVAAGRAALARRQFAAALEAFDAAVAIDPDPADAHAGRGAALFALHRFEAAAAAYDEALELEPDNPDFLVGCAKAAFEDRAYESAITDLNHALAVRPDAAEAVAYRAAAYHDYGNTVEEEWADEDERTGEDEAEAADDEDDVDPAYRVMDGDRESYFDFACAEIRRALELDPRLPAAYFFRGRMLEDYGDEDGAFADYSRAVELDPDYAPPYRERADLWDGWGAADEALADRSRYLTLRPTAGAYHDQAHAWENADDDARAVACFTAAIGLEPDAPRHYSCRAELWAKLGEDDKADADEDAAERLCTGDEGADMNAKIEQRMRVYDLIQEHFRATPLEGLAVTTREFPARVGADIQRALDRITATAAQFWAVHVGGCPPQQFAQLYTRDRHNPPLAVQPESVEVDVGEAEPVRCLKYGVWLTSMKGTNFLVMLDTQSRPGIFFQVAAVAGAAGQAAAARFFAYLEDAVRQGSCYRGKVLSLEYQDSYTGQQYGILVHKVRPVTRDEVILPAATLALLERNVLQFVRRRKQLAELGMQTKKGLLFYGPPGTGKTHTIHYLARGIEGQTTLLVTAEQVGLLGDYMTLARLFQPSMVVIEDVDLIARDRASMHSPGEEVLLNKLLNEMDGLKPETDILFVLTTNRPEMLEAALASRPGRIDQAIEFPLPDADGRAKLVRLYSKKVEVPDAVAALVVDRTERVSASFIKELMRRATQYYLERDGTGPLDEADVTSALDEMLSAGGALNRILLGAAAATPEG